MSLGPHHFHWKAWHLRGRSCVCVVVWVRCSSTSVLGIWKLVPQFVVLFRSFWTCVLAGGSMSLHEDFEILNSRVTRLVFTRLNSCLQFKRWALSSYFSCHVRCYCHTFPPWWTLICWYWSQINPLLCKWHWSLCFIITAVKWSRWTDADKSIPGLTGQPV